MKIRKMIFVVTGLMFLLSFAACFGGDSPSTVTKKFYAAVRKNDAKEMGKYATAETVATITMFGEKMQGMTNSYGDIKSATEKIDGDTAVVSVTFASGDEDDFDLVKVDGKWKVSLSK